MENENSGYNILEYLKKYGATNTFKLAHILGIKRDKLLKILKSLEEEELVRIVLGKAEFLSYSLPRKKKERKPKVSEEKPEAKISEEEIEKQKLYIKKLKDQIKKLKQKPPKIIRKIIVKEVKPKPIEIPKPLKIKQKRRKKIRLIKKAEKKIKKAKPKIKPFKKHRKFFRKIKKLKLPKFKVKGALKFFNVKNFIKHLKRRQK